MCCARVINASQHERLFPQDDASAVVVCGREDVAERLGVGGLNRFHIAANDSLNIVTQTAHVCKNM